MCASLRAQTHNHLTTLGDDDFVTCQHLNAPEGVRWFRNDGSGAFETISFGQYCHAVEIADLDGDGHQDIIGVSSGSARWYRNQFVVPGDITFDGPDGTVFFTGPSGMSLYNVAAADVNGDGFVDVVRMTKSTNFTYVFLVLFVSFLTPHHLSRRLHLT